MSKIKLALVGAGVIGKRHLRALGDTENVELVGIADPYPAARQTADEYQVPCFSTTQEMLKAVRPDGVIVATPTEHHCEPTLQALDGGAHLLVEKPLMATLEECQRTIAKSGATGKHVLVGHHRRYYDLVNQARQIIRQGELGQLVSVSGQWNVRKPADYYQADWRRKWQAGPILTNLIHEMDLLRYIVGDVKSIAAETSNSVQNFEKEDAAALIIRFANGALGTFMLSDQAHSPWSWEQATGENVAFPRTGQNVIQFAGTEGALEFPNLKLWKSTGGESCWTNPLIADPLGGELEDAYINQLTHFAAVIDGREAPRIDAQDATDTLRATLAVYEAAASGSRVLL
ncbi:oxidoreductase [Chromatiales bacterium (ex Bugula neritina AB1)]|nr:oxidoreductase [Chromatiales bacterium (ex Bugula neritina AB1)]